MTCKAKKRHRPQTTPFLKNISNTVYKCRPCESRIALFAFLQYNDYGVKSGACFKYYQKRFIYINEKMFN